MIDLPTMVYRSPGDNKKPTGGTYKYIGIKTQEELEEKLADGWFLSSSEAIEAAGDKANGVQKPKPKWAMKPIKKKKEAKPLNWREIVKAPAQEPEPDDTAPTREELEAKATELGIKFDGRTKDKKLGQLIQDKLSEPTGE